MITNTNVAPVARKNDEQENENVFMTKEEYQAAFPNSTINPMRIMGETCPQIGCDGQIVWGKIRANVMHGKQEQGHCQVCGMRVYRKLMSAREYCESIGKEFVAPVAELGAAE